MKIKSILSALLMFSAFLCAGAIDRDQTTIKAEPARVDAKSGHAKLIIKLRDANGDIADANLENFEFQFSLEGTKITYVKHFFGNYVFDVEYHNPSRTEEKINTVTVLIDGVEINSINLFFSSL